MKNKKLVTFVFGVLMAVSTVGIVISAKQKEGSSKGVMCYNPQTNKATPGEC